MNFDEAVMVEMVRGGKTCQVDIMKEMEDRWRTEHLGLPLVDEIYEQTVNKDLWFTEDLSGTLGRIELDASDWDYLKGRSVEQRELVMRVHAWGAGEQRHMDQILSFIKGEIFELPVCDNYRKVFVESVIAHYDKGKAGSLVDLEKKMVSDTALEDQMVDVDTNREKGNMGTAWAGATKIKPVGYKTHSVSQLIATFQLGFDDKELEAISSLFGFVNESRKKLASDVKMALLKVLLLDSDIPVKEIRVRQKDKPVELKKMKCNNATIHKIKTAATSERVCMLTVPANSLKSTTTIAVTSDNEILPIATVSDAVNYCNDAVKIQNHFDGVPQVAKVPALDVLEQVDPTLSFVKYVNRGDGFGTLALTRPFVKDQSVSYVMNNITKQTYPTNAYADFLSEGEQTDLMGATQLAYNIPVKMQIWDFINPLVSRAQETCVLMRTYQQYVTSMVSGGAMEVPVGNLSETIGSLNNVLRCLEYSHGQYSLTLNQSYMFHNAIVDWHYSLDQLVGTIPIDLRTECIDSYMYCQYFNVKKKNDYRCMKRFPADNPVCTAYENYNFEKTSSSDTGPIDLLVDFRVEVDPIQTKKSAMSFFTGMQYDDFVKNSGGDKKKKKNKNMVFAVNEARQIAYVQQVLKEREDDLTRGMILSVIIPFRNLVEVVSNLKRHKITYSLAGEPAVDCVIANIQRVDAITRPIARAIAYQNLAFHRLKFVVMDLFHGNNYVGGMRTFHDQMMTNFKVKYKPLYDRWVDFPKSLGSIATAGSGETTAVMYASMSRLASNMNVSVDKGPTKFERYDPREF